MESLGINQKEVAKQCGLAPGMFKRIKEGKNLYLETYLKIVNWLKVEFKEFLI
jgi:transcriptional regulator with XRE-family HTH domain